MSRAEAGVALDTPGITILGFSSVPSSSTWWSLSACHPARESPAAEQDVHLLMLVVMLSTRA